MQQLSHSIKLGEIGVRQCNIWIYSAYYNQNEAKKPKQTKQGKTHLVWYSHKRKKLSSD